MRTSESLTSRTAMAIPSPAATSSSTRRARARRAPIRSPRRSRGAGRLCGRHRPRQSRRAKLPLPSPSAIGAFGSGVVSKIQPMGGDALLEVEFETAGTKRLMMRAAGQFMKKEP